jgi:hypothetical protein
LVFNRSSSFSEFLEAPMTCLSRPWFVLSAFLILATICTAQPQMVNPNSSEETQQRRNTGVAMLREAISSSRDLVQPVNRIYIEANCVPLLWDVDEPLARSLVKSLEERYRDLNRQVATLPRDQQNLLQPGFAMRRQVVSAVAAHDPALALEFLRSTRPADARNPNEEADLELTLASQAARQNSKLAADLLRNASGDNSGMMVPALEQLYQADPAVGTQAAADLVGRLATANLSNRQSLFAAVQLLQMYGNAAQPAAQNGFAGQAGRSPVITSTGLQPLAQAIIAAAQKPDFPPDLQQMVQNILPTLQKLSPSQGATVVPATKNNSGNNAVNDFWQQLNEVTAHGKIQQGIELAQSAPEEIRWQAYSQIANKLAGDGDFAGATELIQNAQIMPEQRQQLLENASRNAMWKAANQGLFEQARAAAANIEDPAERASMLIQMAQNAIGRKQPELARQLLEETRGLLPNPPGDLQDMNELSQLANAYISVDAARSSEILGSLVATVNQKLPALATADGFYWGQRSFMGNEMLMQAGSAAGMMREISNTLATLAVNNPDYSASLAGQLQRPEARTLAYLEIAQRLLAQSQQGPGQLRAVISSGVVRR